VKTELFTLEGRADKITCPMLVTAAENESPRGPGATIRRTELPLYLLKFTAAESRARQAMPERALDEVESIPISGRGQASADCG
jgi:hypothetical protein